MDKIIPIMILRTTFLSFFIGGILGGSLLWTIAWEKIKLLFRLAIQGRILKFIGVPTAIEVVSILFALMHFIWFFLFLL